MLEFKIDPEFRDVLPSKEEDYIKLEKTVLEDGRFTDPIITWNGFIIDGHTRYRIMQNHPEVDLKPYEKKMDDVIPDRYAAIVWIATHQEARRNLNEFEWAEIHKKAYDAQKKSVGAQKGHKSFGNQYEKRLLVESDQLAQTGSTAATLSKEFGMSPSKLKHSVRIGNAMEEAERLVPGAKEAIKSGKTSVTKTMVEAVLDKNEEGERKQFVEEILTGKPKTQPPKKPKDNYKEVRDRFGEIRKIAEQMGGEKTGITFDDVIRLLNTIADDFIGKVERTVNGDRETLTGDDRWPDAIEGYFDSVINDIHELKGRII